MAKIVASKNRKKRRGLKIFVFTLLLAAAGAVLSGIPPFLLDINRIIRSAAGNLSHHPAGNMPAATVLRGTIYDQGFNELAVSYRLHTLRARPAEVTDIRRAADELSRLTGKPAAEIEGALKSSRQSLTLMDDLDEARAQAINDLDLPGIVCSPAERRFYPAHTAASHVLGFMGERSGLAGLEGRYDAALAAKGARAANIPGIDFKGRESLGEDPVDLILTLDLRLQRRLEQLLHSCLNSRGGKGMGLLLEPGSGRILALANYPAFNPNYFWMAQEGSRENRIFSRLLDSELIRPVLVRAAAIEREGVDARPLLPVTVAAPDYGFSESMLENFANRIRLFDAVSDSWEGGVSQESLEGKQKAVTGVQIGATLASLVNGGWRINPYLVDSLYDHADGVRYRRKDDFGRAHVLDPALSVQLRRNLFEGWRSEKDDMLVYRAAKTRPGLGEDGTANGAQRLFVGLAPAAYPKYLLVLAAEGDQGGGQAAGKDAPPDLDRIGRDMLAWAVKNPTREITGEIAMQAPPPKSAENMQQYFISRRHAAAKTPEEIALRAATMPDLQGLSLRRALRLVAPHKMKVSVKGSGRVVAQQPEAKSSLLGVHECTLTLATP